MMCGLQDSHSMDPQMTHTYNQRAMYCGRNLLGEGERMNKWQWRGEEANQARSNVFMLQVLDVSEALPDLVVWNG